MRTGSLTGITWNHTRGYLPLVAAQRGAFRRLPAIAGLRLGIVVALSAGAADILGVTSFSAGSEAGFISIVVAASAVFPAIAVGLSIAFLRERLVANQWVGVSLVLPGLMMIGLGSS